MVLLLAILLRTRDSRRFIVGTYRLLLVGVDTRRSDDGFGWLPVIWRFFIGITWLCNGLPSRLLLVRAGW